MEIIEVKASTVIAKIAYDNTDLFVKFIDTGWYIYCKVPVKLFNEFKAAQSKGTFVNKRIKPHFKGVPCTNPELRKGAMRCPE